MNPLSVSNLPILLFYTILSNKCDNDEVAMLMSDHCISFIALLIFNLNILTLEPTKYDNKIINSIDTLQILKFCVLSLNY